MDRTGNYSVMRITTIRFSPDVSAVVTGTGQNRENRSWTLKSDSIALLSINAGSQMRSPEASLRSERAASRRNQVRDNSQIRRVTNPEVKQLFSLKGD
jgi:hypothetical protein